MTDHELDVLRQRCHTFFPGHRQLDPASEFAAMAAYCRHHQISHDTYGEGTLLSEFEQKIATLLGMESAVFCITGTLAQSVALRLACLDRNNSIVGLHASAHVLKHENSNHQLLDQFKTVQIGQAQRIWTAEDLSSVADRLGAVLLELPMRELGGQLPSWEQLQQIKQQCQQRNSHLHLDGARLWEAQAAYGRPFAEITSGFDSVYVSFYKGIGALGGAMLLGSAEFIARARVWMQRQGGNVIHRSPYVISAAMQFEQRLAAMPAYLARARQVADLLKQFPRMQLNPTAPQCNLFHVYFPVSVARAIELRNQIASEQGIWLFNRASHAALPEQCTVEWYVGDNVLGLSDEQITAGLARFNHLMQP